MEQMEVMAVYLDCHNGVQLVWIHTWSDTVRDPVILCIILTNIGRDDIVEIPGSDKIVFQP